MKAKLKELREKENSHLEHELAETQKHLYDLRSQAVTEKLEDPSQLGKARRHIAQLKTMLHERQLAAAKTAAAAAK
jgi:large subunit ribosomal protein L29